VGAPRRGTTVCWLFWKQEARVPRMMHISHLLGLISTVIHGEIPAGTLMIGNESVTTAPRRPPCHSESISGRPIW